MKGDEIWYVVCHHRVNILSEDSSRKYDGYSVYVAPSNTRHSHAKLSFNLVQHGWRIMLFAIVGYV